MSSGRRVASLDAFRGITVAGMILVNNAGDWKHVYGQLRHAAWHGLTATDLVFPFFLFIVGVAIAVAKPKEPAAILRRGAILVALGIFLNAFPFVLPREHYRIPGVLQRIGIAYAVAALIARRVSWRGQAGIGAGLILVYGLVQAFVPVPDRGAPSLDEPELSFGAWLDRTLMPGRLYEKGWDPEGLFSTLPAIATALSGTIAARWVAAPRQMISVGVGVGVAGVVAMGFFPINKNLWSPSYVLATSGLAMVFLGGLTEVMDGRGWRAWARPFEWFGQNPILAYLASSLLARLLVYGISIDVDGKPVAAKAWLYERTFGRGGSNELTSLGWAVSYLSIWTGVVWALDRKKVYLKV